MCVTCSLIEEGQGGHNTGNISILRNIYRIIGLAGALFWDSVSPSASGAPGSAENQTDLTWPEKKHVKFLILIRLPVPCCCEQAWSPDF